jgi:hypothetical protein
VLQRTTHLLDGTKDVHMTKDMFIRSILPIGVLFSGSLILSNTAYLYLSVSYIQMLKVGLCCLPTFDALTCPRHSHPSPFSLSRGHSASKTRTRSSPSSFS